MIVRVCTNVYASSSVQTPGASCSFFRTLSVTQISIKISLVTSCTSLNAEVEYPVYQGRDIICLV